MWLLWVLAGCPGPDVESEQCLPAVPDDPCAEVDCTDVCGTPFARGPGPGVVGWEVVEVPHPDASEVVRIGEVAASVDGIALRTFSDADLAPLGILGPLDGPNAIGPAGDGVVVQVGDGVLVTVSIADPEHPVATAAWHPLERLSEEDRVSVRMAGTWRGRIVLQIDASATVAIVDFSDHAAPVVEACLHDRQSDGIGEVRVTDAFVAVGSVLFRERGPVALFDPWMAETPFAHVRNEGTFAVDGDRIAVWEHLDEVVLYEVAGGVASEIGRRQANALRTQTPPRVVGGVAIDVGPFGPEATLGLDLRDPALPLVFLDPWNSGFPCPAEVRDEGGVPLFDIAAGWFPSDRFAPGTAPECPGGASDLFANTSDTVSPDGTAILVRRSDGPWEAFRPADRSFSPTAMEGDVQGRVAWLDGAFVWWTPACYAGGGLHLLSEDGATEITRGVAGYPLWLAPDGEQAWFLTDPAGDPCLPFDYVPPDYLPGVEAPVAWRVSTDGALTEIDLPDPSLPRALLPAGDHLALIDHNGHHRLMSRDGAVLAELSGVPMKETAQFAASSAGVFTSDLEHGVWVTRTEGASSLAPACSGTRVVGAEGPHVRWNRWVRPAPWFAAYIVTELVDPETGGVAASLPARAWGGRVQGRPGALVGHGIYVVNDP